MRVAKPDWRIEMLLGLDTDEVWARRFGVTPTDVYLWRKGLGVAAPTGVALVPEPEPPEPWADQLRDYPALLEAVGRIARMAAWAAQLGYWEGPTRMKASDIVGLVVDTQGWEAPYVVGEKRKAFLREELRELPAIRFAWGSFLTAMAQAIRDEGQRIHERNEEGAPVAMVEGGER
jgi:hypothetical protein